MNIKLDIDEIIINKLLYVSNPVKCLLLFIEIIYVMVITIINDNVVIKIKI